MVENFYAMKNKEREICFKHLRVKSIKTDLDMLYERPFIVAQEGGDHNRLFAPLPFPLNPPTDFNKYEFLLHNMGTIVRTSTFSHISIYTAILQLNIFH